MSMHMRSIQTLAVAISLFLSVSLVSKTSATVSGPFDITNDTGGGVILSLTSIDFASPVGGGIGSMVSGIGTNVTFTGGGPLTPGSFGVIKDLTTGGGAVSDFMTFSIQPNLHFDLTALGPGVVNTIAATTFDPNLPPSSPISGSPFILQATTTGTSLTFSASGTARDTSGLTSNWSGLFTTQFVGVTPFQVQQTLLTGGTVSSTYSGAFQAVVPEPGTCVLLVGSLLCGLAVRRKLPRQGR
jgi:hypothetical protein